MEYMETSAFARPGGAASPSTDIVALLRARAEMKPEFIAVRLSTTAEAVGDIQWLETESPDQRLSGSAEWQDFEI